MKRDLLITFKRLKEWLLSLNPEKDSRTIIERRICMGWKDYSVISLWSNLLLLNTVNHKK